MAFARQQLPAAFPFNGAPGLGPDGSSRHRESRRDQRGKRRGVTQADLPQAHELITQRPFDGVTSQQRRRTDLGAVDREELLCSVIGLTVKVTVGLLAGVSLFHLAGAYQQRLDRHDELSAILNIENAKLRKAQDRFDQLFSTEGEQRLIREQDQWIAPDRLRVVWEQPKRTLATRPSI